MIWIAVILLGLAVSFAISVLLGKGFSAGERILLSPGIFVTLAVASTAALDTFFGTGIRKASSLFCIGTLLAGIALAFFCFARKSKARATRPEKTDFLFLVPATISAALWAFYLSLTGGFPQGADTTTFAYFSKAFSLGDSFKPPVFFGLGGFSAEGFSYPPIALFFPAIFPELGNPISQLVGVSAILAVASSGLVYFAFRRMFGEEGGRKGQLQALFSSVAFSVALNVPLEKFISRGQTSYSIGWYFFISLITVFLAYIGKKGGSKKGLGALLGLFAASTALSHTYHLVGFSIFSAVFLFFAKKQPEQSEKGAGGILASLIIFALFILPFAPIFISGPLSGSGGTYALEKISDWKYGEYHSESRPLFENALVSLFGSRALGKSAISIPAIAGALFFLLLIGEERRLGLRVGRERKALFYFAVLSGLAAVSLQNSLTFHRFSDLLAIPYSIGFGLAFSRAFSGSLGKIAAVSIFTLAAVALILPASTASLVYGTLSGERALSDYSSEEELEAFRFIGESLPADSVFLIEGTGMGCIGGQEGSHGEMIFPLTGRGVFLFSNYCWADYDRDDLAWRIDLVRRFSIDPDSEQVRKDLLSSNVTHIYVGKNPAIFDIAKMKESSGYRQVFPLPFSDSARPSDEQAGPQIFEVTFHAEE